MLPLWRLQLPLSLMSYFTICTIAFIAFVHLDYPLLLTILVVVGIHFGIFVLVNDYVCSHLCQLCAFYWPFCIYI